MQNKFMPCNVYDVVVCANVYVIHHTNDSVKRYHSTSDEIIYKEIPHMGVIEQMSQFIKCPLNHFDDILLHAPIM